MRDFILLAEEEEKTMTVRVNCLEESFQMAQKQLRLT